VRFFVNFEVLKLIEGSLPFSVVPEDPRLSVRILGHGSRDPAMWLGTSEGLSAFGERAARPLPSVMGYNGRGDSVDGTLDHQTCCPIMHTPDGCIMMETQNDGAATAVTALR